MSRNLAGDPLAELGVSRETIERLKGYEALLKKWNPAINLVSNRSIVELWDRHFLDSAQLFVIAAPTSGVWVDLGSGGGFPGLVVATLARELAPDLRVVLVESDRRKAAFLMTVIRELDLPARVEAERIEAIAPLHADYLSARALAPLTALLGFAELHLAAGGTCIFPKGETWRDELAEAQKLWSFAAESHPSATDSGAHILVITGVKRA